VTRQRRTSGDVWEREAAKEVVVHKGPSGSADAATTASIPRPPAAWFKLERSMSQAAIEAVEEVKELMQLQHKEEEEEEEKEKVGNGNDGDGDGESNTAASISCSERAAAAAAAAARRVLFSWLDQEELLPSPEFPVEDLSFDAPSASSASSSSSASASFASTSASFCSLAPAPEGRRFARRDLRAYLSGLFRSIPDARRRDGLPPVSLSRFDLFHAHFFLAGIEPLLLALEEDKKKNNSNNNNNNNNNNNKRAPSVSLGLLFHAAEYPALCPLEFPHDLGWCQRGSDVRWSEETAAWRTLVAARGRLASVRLGAGRTSSDEEALLAPSPSPSSVSSSSSTSLWPRSWSLAKAKAGSNGATSAERASATSSSDAVAAAASARAVVADALVWPELREMRTLLETDLGIWLGDGVLCVGGGGGGRGGGGGEGGGQGGGGEEKEEEENEREKDVLVYVPGLMF